MMEKIPKAPRNNMIEVHHLTKHFGNIKAVQDISFTVKKGEIFVLLGTSGCGKTTTLKMINRLVEPEKGEIWIDGKDSRAQKPEILRRHIGYVMQNTGLFPHYTVAENIAVVADLLKWDKVKISSRAEILLKKFHLSPEVYLSFYPGQLSGGQQQRVGFVRALMADPPILLMDEPLGALDPITRHQIRKEFKQLDELRKKTIILVTHDIPEAFELGDRICLMDQGRIQQTGSATDLLLHPRNDFVKNFFSSDKFMLQLKAFKIQDILSVFSPENHKPEREETLSANVNIMNAIEQFSTNDSKDKKINIVDENKGQYYRLGMNDLLTAFQQKINSA